MLYSGVPSGWLETSTAYPEYKVEDIIDRLAGDVVLNTPDLGALPDELKLHFIQAVKKAVVLGLESSVEDTMERMHIDTEDEEALDGIVEVVMGTIGVTPDSTDITYEQVQQAARQAAGIARTPMPTEDEIAALL